MTPTSELLQLAAKCLVNRPPDLKTNESPKAENLTDFIKNGWWKMPKIEITQQTSSNEKDQRHTDNQDVTCTSKISDQYSLCNSVKQAVNKNDSKMNTHLSEEKDKFNHMLSHLSTSTEESARTQLKQAGINMESQTQKQCVGTDSISYESLFRRDFPFETSSVRSDTSTLSDTSQDSPKKSPRKPRLAARFDIPLDG